MANTFVPFTVKSSPEHRDDMLRTLSWALRRRGVTDPNIGPDSDYFVTCTALGNELAVIGANCVIKCDEQMPDTADDDEDAGTFALSRIAAILGLAKRSGAGSVGFVVNDVTAATVIAVGAGLTDQYGQKYKVTVGGTSVANGDFVAIEAVTLGKSTNLAAGASLKWDNAPPYSAPSVLVATGGLVNGADPETNEELRARIFAFFQNPPAGGNWSHVAAIAEASTPRVQKAFVYPAVEGPGTTHVALTASPTDTNKNRDVASSVMSGTVVPYVTGQLNEHAYIVTTTVANVNADVAFGLTLPEAPTANPPGPGGGWLDGTPWPSVDGVSYFRVTVTSVTSTTRFVCDAQTVPTAGVSHICWLSPIDWTLYRARVTAVNVATPGAIDVTIDTPFPNLAAGSYIFPDSQNAATYVQTVLDSFAIMGPGEKTSNASALIRGFRHPRNGAAYPYTMGPHLTNALSKLTEVASAHFLHRTDGTTTLTGPGGVVSPQIPAAIESAPNQYVPHNIAFYRIA